jgi:hypothetical protein
MSEVRESRAKPGGYWRPEADSHHQICGLDARKGYV